VNINTVCLKTAIIRTALRSRIVLLFVFTAGALQSSDSATGQDFERDPINYASAPANNAVSRLQAALDEDRKYLERDDHQGYLRSVLKEFDIPISSQTLVFSKTSLQRHRISPRTPRAIYFNDDVYIGFCQQGDVLEVSAVEPALGAVFYTLAQEPNEKPTFLRHNDNCLICHGSSNTRGVPGHLIRSVYVDHSGLPVLSMGTHRIDHTSPIEKRWGGWYVTGTHGPQTHLGNLTISNGPQREPVDNSAGQNVTSLDLRFDTSTYLSPHSDLIALMVLEHQAEAHNLLTRANFQTREALYAETRLNKDLGEPPEHRWDSTTTRIKNACEALVKYLLFCDEAPLTAPLRGTTSFAVDFAARGPRDSQGRSLRDFDLERRLFRFPCSYLIYSRSFDELPAEAKSLVFERLWSVLNGTDQSREFSHLSKQDRKAILEILLETKPGLPNKWFPTVSETISQQP
jgi:hypothetical protein